MLEAILHNFELDFSYHREYPTQYLTKDRLKEFLSMLFDTTIAMSESGSKEQILDVFYGTLILYMIRFVLFSAFRYYTYDWVPVSSQANLDPTFLDGTKSQIYRPMLFLLESSKATFQQKNAHSMRAAAVVNHSNCGSSSASPPTSMFMYSHATNFISHYSQVRHLTLRAKSLR